VHHDTSQTPVDHGAFPANVRFVEKPHKTAWGKWSLVAGGLDALSLIYQRSDWCFLLSAADYPITAGERVRKELAGAKVDAFMDCHPLLPIWKPSAHVVGTANPSLAHFMNAQNQKIRQRFYLSPQVMLPVVRRDPKWRIGRHTFRPPIQSPLAPFDRKVGCFVGDQWFAANRKAVARLVEDSPLKTRLVRHYWLRNVPDESFYQTMLLNQMDLVIDRDSRRFTEWNGGGSHPQLLTEADLPAALAAGDFFARKFAHGATVLDRIDEVLVS
jgi:hypothetical protein